MSRIVGEHRRRDISQSARLALRRKQRIVIFGDALGCRIKPVEGPIPLSRSFAADEVRGATSPNMGVLSIKVQSVR